MSAWVLGLVLAAAGSTDVSGAVTVGGRLRQTQAGSIGALVHGRVELARDFGRFFVEGHGSVLLTGSTAAVGLSDLGSSLTLGYHPLGFVKRVSLEFIPFNPSIRLPSFDWANAWGNTITQTITPMITGQVETTAGALFLSGRFKSVLDPLTQTNEVRPDLFIGLDAPLSNSLRLEVRAAALDYGLNPSLGSLGVRVPLFAGAGGARLSWTWNEFVGPAIDLTTYATDPLRFERFFASEPRRSPFAAWVALEAGGGAQQLADPDRFGSGKLQPMAWADLQVRVRLRELRLFGTARLQSFSFLVFDRTGTPPSIALAQGATATPFIMGIVGADWSLRALKLTPGVLFRVSQYASRTAPPLAGGNNPPPGPASRILLVGPNGYFSQSTRGSAQSVLAVKGSVRWEVVSFASVVAEVDVEQDFNDLSIDPSVAPLLTPLTLTAQLFVQARF